MIRITIDNGLDGPDRDISHTINVRTDFSQAEEVAALVRGALDQMVIAGTRSINDLGVLPEAPTFIPITVSRPGESGAVDAH